jgi:hypothetical protein
MTASLPAVKVAALIPRLGSLFDGEVIATVRAIERVLKSQGFDLNDLAESIRQTPQAPKFSRLPQRQHSKWADIPPPDRRAFLFWLLEQSTLTDWDEEFVAGVIRYRDRLSPKQIAVIDKIIKRCAERGWM